MNELHVACKENATNFPPIMEELAGRLRVTPSVLAALEIGYLPDRSAWTIPHRNPAGEVVGLGLRFQESAQPHGMVKGSKVGLIFPCRANPYVPGASNWVRTMDVSLSCPVCGKPDGCLLSAEDPSDPRAVICIRPTMAAGAREVDGGYLHVLKPEGKVSRGVLPATDLPILVVEGMSDVAAALDMGFVAVGRSSALSTKGLITLLGGKRVFVLGEHDDGAGVAGMEKTVRALSAVARPTAVMPPAGFKDLRAWKDAGLTSDELLSFVDESRADTTSDPDTLDTNEPLFVASAWLRANFWDTDTDCPTLYTNEKRWFAHDGRRYRALEDSDTIEQRVLDWLSPLQYLNGKGGVAKFRCSRSYVGDLLFAMKRDCVRDLGAAPLWLDGRTTPTPSRVISFADCLYDVDTATRMPATTQFFTSAVLAVPYSAEMDCPVWFQYLMSVFGEAPDAEARRDLLQEWFGYHLIPDMTKEKFMMFVGGSRSGKSTALVALTAILGSELVSTPSLASLSTRFGRETLPGKYAAFVTDAHMPRRTDPKALLETLLAIVGRDGVQVEPKFKRAKENVQLTCRFTFATNEIPRIPDPNHALEQRLLTLSFDQSFRGREDETLKDKLRAEAPGIARWALEGLFRLLQEGAFTMPATSLPLIQEFRTRTRPVEEFIGDCCSITEGTLPLCHLYDIWKEWAQDNGLHTSSLSVFRSALSHIEGVGVETREDEPHATGLRVHPWAERRYGG